jgi:2-keto-3-deoxy-L-rhamnonate aldolase RhmA
MELARKYASLGYQYLTVGSDSNYLASGIERYLKG